ncbi:SusC/RagA family TonB-linked outer membrane protein [Chitinophaga tropicalis]|uniref:SusC/RagA family TonB-linked outer membrane protein n=1 Tax=Chitinophaga tropicalis TaxID=2683588 RepID=A0A7K1TYM2_9BACT|nr:SusC/RagA family TonB-linked outer membrane protein [Chitinophaga tropicalis]MVT06865.1 SusC/RagA family TonB-linked outer membrane protein [Chitinophaga tropicalis]
MRKSLFFLLSALLLVGQVVAQNRTITGKVTSGDDGQPVIGATVIVKGTSVGTVTNTDGVYTIQVPEGAGVLVVKFVGMKDQELKATGTKANVVLYPDVTKLTETVVTANAIRRDKSSLGYAAPTLKNDELTKGQSTSPLNALAGKVAGVNISTSANAPGSSSRIVLRGGSSIAGNNQALMVIDGVPIDNSSIIGGGDSRSTVDFGNRGNDINPEDIESVTVLKGPAAAALYGSRASNGALIITTKSGKKAGANKKNEVTFNTGVTFSNIAKLPEFQNRYGQGYDMAVIDPRENWSWGPEFDGVEREWGQSINGVRQKKAYSAAKNNVKDFFELGKAINSNLSLSGAGEKTTYYLSLNSLNSDGVMPGDYDKYNKYGIRFNGTAQLNNKISTSVSFNYNKINSQMIQGGQGDASVFDNVLQTPRDIPVDKMGDLSNPYNSFGNTFDENGNPTYGYYGAYTKSPYYILKNYKNLNDVDRITGNFTLNYKPLAWLDVVERVGADVYSDRRTYKYPKFDLLPADDIKRYYKPGSQNQTSLGMYSKDQYNLSEVTHDLMVTAKKTFGDFNTSLMVGHNIRQRIFNTTEMQTNPAGLVVPGLYNADNSNGPLVTFDEVTKRRLIGLYGELNVSYKNMIYLGATARNDWSSTLPVQNRSFFYPSVNGAFVFTELTKDTKLAEILNYGKVRASWAQVGNDADPYLLRTYYQKAMIDRLGFGNTTFPLDGVNGFTLGDLIGNPNLKPEITTAFEVGTELNFLDNRLSVDFSYYSNRSKDQILKVPLPPSSGFTQKTLNTGVVENKGVELSLRGTPLRTASGFTLELFGTYTKNTNKVLDITGADQVVIGGLSGMSIVAAKGKPYGTFYAQDIQRDDQGRVIVSSNTGMPLLTSGAVYLGSYNPKYQASWGANASYKNFSFSILFDTKQGNKFFSRTKDILDFTGAAYETAVGGRENTVWENSVVDDGTGKLVPNTSVTYDKQNWFPSVIPSGQHIVDASYIRLREASLSYRLPQHLLNRTPFGGLSVGVFGNNLALWTAKENRYADPEVNSGGAGNEQGFDFTAQPSLRNFGFNVRVTF